MKREQYEERPQLQIDLFEVQQEWEWRQEQEQKKKAEEKKVETVIIIDI